MAKRPIHIDKLSDDIMNGDKSYRVAVDREYFSVMAKHTKSGVYFYVNKRIRRKLHKAYVGRSGAVDRAALLSAIDELRSKEDEFWSRNKSRRRNLYGYE